MCGFILKKERERERERERAEKKARQACHALLSMVFFV